jgi:hypothetical protein
MQVNVYLLLPILKLLPLILLKPKKRYSNVIVGISEFLKKLSSGDLNLNLLKVPIANFSIKKI